LVNVSKRYRIAAAAHNLGRIMRLLFGIGKPKGLEDEGGFAALVQLLAARGWSIVLALKLIVAPMRGRLRFCEPATAIRFAA
jgi:hypothetical protein